MDQTIDCTPLTLAAHRLLDSMQARPRSLLEFEQAVAQAIRCAHAAFQNAPQRRRSADRGWTSVAARLGRALRAAGHEEADGLRLGADLLCLPRLCERSACRKARMCRDTPRGCLRRSAQRAPEAVRTAVLALTERFERGDTLELAVALLPFESKLALWGWQRAAAPTP